MDVKITEIPYEEGLAFYEENGLEISESGNDAPVLYCRGIYENGVLIAAAAVTLKFEKKVLDYIAVRPEFRKRGLGERLLFDVFARLMQNGSDRLWLVAKTPAFFYAVGAEDTEEGKELLLECNGCEMRGIQCNPKVMAFEKQKGDRK
ncbi:MAG: GNAT family N-acetyltransferase [Lachnospiraceae bacterium]|nr:GNAT family N-acetyltransferase [Lachnospiraceae bacterium]